MKNVDGCIYRGPKVDLKELMRMQCTLDLESGAQVFGDDMPLLEAIDGDIRNIRVYAHPLGAIFPPSIDELKNAVGFLKMGKTTYIHCKHGVDRTGMVCAAYRILVQNWKPWAAAKEALSEGMHWIYIPWLIQLWRLK